MKSVTEQGLKDRVVRASELIDAQYQIVSIYHLNEEKPIILKDTVSPRRCRFCGKSEPEVSFKKVAHALSHMVENRHLKSEYECDSCNELFATYETDYSAYMNLYHTMFQVHGKGGIPKFKNNSRAESKISFEGDTIKINIMEGEEPLVIWEEKDKETNSIKIVGERTYTPVNVLKTLVKMALSVMPENEMINVVETKKWLQNQKVEGYVFNAFIRLYREALPFTSCLVLKKKDNVTDNIPFYQFVLAYKSFVIQVPIPFIEVDKLLKDTEYRLTPFPTPLDETQVPFAKGSIKLSSTEKIRGERVEIGLKYSSAEETTGEES